MAERIDKKISSLNPRSSFFSLEVFPPKTAAGFQNLIPRLTRLAYLSPLFVCVTFNAGGTTAQKSVQLADFCQNQLNLTTCLHLTCTNIAIELIDWVLAEAKRIGIRNILALRGDEPRRQENDIGTSTARQDSHSGQQEHFSHAVDLIRYIKKKHGDHFCIGAAAYPEGHPQESADHAGAVNQSPELDLPYLVEKVQAGAEFLMTQFFFDSSIYTRFEDLLVQHPQGVFADIPVIPGLMPIQGWQSFNRTCKLARVNIPPSLLEKLEAVKADDSAIKRIGVGVLTGIIEAVQKHRSSRDVTVEPKRAQGFHFFTLNLEKVVASILSRSRLTGSNTPSALVNGTKGADGLPAGHHELSMDHQPAALFHELMPKEGAGHQARRISSSSQNRVIVDRALNEHRDRSSSATFEAYPDELVAAGPDIKIEDAGMRDEALSISEGEGSVGREATWDDFPNGRWGDARSPAYGSINNYALHPQLAPTSALTQWGRPTSTEDITSIFQRYLAGELTSNPWSEEPLSVETKLIEKQLLQLNAKAWWTIASQPAVNAARSSDDVVGWGPRRGGFVWQKPFVEMFVPASAWTGHLRKKLDALQQEVAYFAGNAEGDFIASPSPVQESMHHSSSSSGTQQAAAVYPVTWGSFKDKEIITPTIIEPVSFRAWCDEAFQIWKEWERVFGVESESAKLLRQLTQDVWLVNVIGHDYKNGDGLWNILLEA